MGPFASQPPAKSRTSSASLWRPTDLPLARPPLQPANNHSQQHTRCPQATLTPGSSQGSSSPLFVGSSPLSWGPAPGGGPLQHLGAVAFQQPPPLSPSSSPFGCLRLAKRLQEPVLPPPYLGIGRIRNLPSRARRRRGRLLGKQVDASGVTSFSGDLGQLLPRRLEGLLGTRRTCAPPYCPLRAHTEIPSVFAASG